MRSLLVLFMLFLPMPVAAASEIDAVASEIASGSIEGVTGMTISVDGAVIVNAAAPGHGEAKRHDIRSATKSVTALLVGVLVDEGKLKDVDTPAAKILPDDFANITNDDPRRDITVRDLLTMRAGLACDDWAPASVGHEDKMYETKNWTRFLLSQPVAHERGRHFSYCTGGVVLLGRVIEKLAGEPVPDFARRALFAPLGVADVKWEPTPEGGTDTGGHIRLSAADMEKIGRLVLRQGDWNGRRLISAAWIGAATSKQTDIPERKFDYGYLWWLDTIERDGKRHPVAFAMGNGGNFIFVLPDQRAVVAFTAENFNSPKQFIPAELLRDRIMPALLAIPN